MHIHRKQYNNYNPQIKLNDRQIEYVQNNKFLGLIIDNKLNWKSHIQNLKTESMKRMNLLKTLAHHKWGADRETLLKLYNAIIRSRLDYGSIVFRNAKPSYLKILDPIQNTAIRIATGALRTSPTVSLQREANQVPLNLRRTQLSLNYLNNLINHPDIPVYNNIFETTNDQTTLQHTLPLHSYIMDNLVNLNITLPNKSQYSENNIPPWTLKKPKINLKLAKYPQKFNTPRNIQASIPRNQSQTHTHTLPRCFHRRV